MKKAKYVLWIVIIAIFGLVIFQNQDFLLSDQSLGINFYFTAYRTIPLPTAVLFAAVFFVGYLIAYVLGLASRYRSKRSQKLLQQTISDQQGTIDSLTKELDVLKANTAPPEQIPEQTLETTAETANPPAVKEEA